MTEQGEKSKIDEDEDELARRRREEYEMQLFGFHSRTVYAAIEQRIKEKVDTSCLKMYESIEKKYNSDPEQKKVLKNCIKELRKSYHEKMQPHLTTIENTVKKFICVPDNILLEGDKCQATQYTEEEAHEWEKKLEELQQRAKRATMFNALLKEEWATIENIKETEKAAIKLCKIVEQGLETKKMSTKDVQAVEKLKALSETLDDLQTCSKKDIYNPKLNENELKEIDLE